MQVSILESTAAGLVSLDPRQTTGRRLCSRPGCFDTSALTEARVDGWYVWLETDRCPDHLDGSTTGWDANGTTYTLVDGVWSTGSAL